MLKIVSIEEIVISLLYLQIFTKCLWSDDTNNWYKTPWKFF